MSFAAFAANVRTGLSFARLLALALILDGHSRTDAPALNGMDRQTLRDWVHRYNAHGLDGMKSRHSPGAPPALSDEQTQELREIVLRGPDPEIHDVVRWRCVDLRAEVTRRFCVDVHENTIGRWLRELGSTGLQPRPVRPQKDPEAEAAFKKNFAPLVRAELPEPVAGPVARFASTA
jgi:transposase